MDIILASASPRRKELLGLLFDSFRVAPSRFDESLTPRDLDPREHVLYCALMKARDVAAKHAHSLVIGADTIVVVDEQILGKPSDVEDARGMLRMLSGRKHQVYTGVALIENGIERSACESTDVYFAALSEQVISRYISTGEPLDKAGAYAIQGRGAPLITSISGCYFNVVGLPIHRLSVLLREFGREGLNGCWVTGVG